MEINLLNPNRDDLLKKWSHVIDKTRRIFTWDTDAEIAYLCEMVQGKSRYLELGSYVGKSMKSVLLANNNLFGVSLDTWDDEGTLEEYNFNLRDLKGRYNYIQGRTQDTIECLEADDEQFDCCFIDAGHTEDEVAADVRNVMHFMKPGSLLVGHDYAHTNDVALGVKKVLGQVYNPVDSIWAYQL